jgi:hypothetical protein
VDGGLLKSIKYNRILEKYNSSTKYLIAENAMYVHYNDSILFEPDFKEEYLIHFLGNGENIPETRITFPGWNYNIYIWNYLDDDAVKYKENYLQRKINKKIESGKQLYDGLLLDGMHVYPTWIRWYKDSTYLVNGISLRANDFNNIKDKWKNNINGTVKKLKLNKNSPLIVCNDVDIRNAISDSIFKYMDGFISELKISFFLDGLNNVEWEKDIYLPYKHLNEIMGDENHNIIISHYSSTTIFNPDSEIIYKAANDYRRMRFGLTTALLVGAHYIYWVSTSNYGNGYQLWFDEYDNAGKNKTGYLGKPINKPYIMQISTKNKMDSEKTNNNVFGRDYENGLVICNPTSEKKKVILKGLFYHIAGKQDTSINNGKPCNEVEINAKDGIVLLRNKN